MYIYIIIKLKKKIRLIFFWGVGGGNNNFFKLIEFRVTLTTDTMEN